MVERGNMFLHKVASSRHKIARQADKFITDGSVSLFIFYSPFILIYKQQNYAI